MDKIIYGLRGDLFRGATPVGFTVPVALSLTAVKDALAANPLASKFRLQVNQYAVDAAASIAEAFEVPIEIVAVNQMGKDEWLCEPIE